MRGFFIAELLVVMSLIGVFAALTITGYSQLEQFFLTRSGDTEVRTLLDRTRNLSLAMYQNDGWSFRVENNQPLIFKGDDFANRDTDFDEFYELPKKTSATTSSDLYFEMMTGIIGSDETVSIIFQNGSSTDIDISSNGFIK